MNSSYDTCPICGEYGWARSHTCPPTYQVFEIDGNDFSCIREIRAESAEDAAIKYVTIADYSGADYRFAQRGGSVCVKKEDDEKIEMFQIEGRMEPCYDAESLPVNEKILASCKEYIRELEEL